MGRKAWGREHAAEGMEQRAWGKEKRGSSKLKDKS